MLKAAHDSTVLRPNGEWTGCTLWRCLSSVANTRVLKLMYHASCSTIVKSQYVPTPRRQWFTAASLSQNISPLATLKLTLLFDLLHLQ